MWPHDVDTHETPSRGACLTDVRPHSADTQDALTQLKACAGANTPALISCRPTLEGVLCGVGLAYLAHARPELVRLCGAACAQPQLGEQLVCAEALDPDEQLALARRVHAGLARATSEGCERARFGSCAASCGASCVRKISYACASDDPAMPEAVHRYARLAFAERGRVRALISHPAVATLDDLARRTLNECEKTRQFVRFSKLRDDSFLAVFRPAASTLPFVSRHFAERMQEDRFCIVDPAHLVACFHERGSKGCATVTLDEGTAHMLVAREGDLAQGEELVRAMWRAFYEALELPGRDASQRGYDLRTKWVPKRLWSGLPELT